MMPMIRNIPDNRVYKKNRIELFLQAVSLLNPEQKLNVILMLSSQVIVVQVNHYILLLLE